MTKTKIRIVPGNEGHGPRGVLVVREKVADKPNYDADKVKEAEAVFKRPGAACIVTFPCGHSFHYTCAVEWLSSGHGNCPYCRAEIGKVVRLAASRPANAKGKASR